MVKANIETNTGLKIAVEGSAEEISSIIDYVKNKDHKQTPKKQSPGKKKKTSSSSSTGLIALILNLKSDGFFNKPQKTGDVKEKLAQQAHHYSLTSISTTLIRLVQRGELGRIKEENTWAYVRR